MFIRTVNINCELKFKTNDAKKEITLKQFVLLSGRSTKFSCTFPTPARYSWATSYSDMPSITLCSHLSSHISQSLDSSRYYIVPPTPSSPFSVLNFKCELRNSFLTPNLFLLLQIYNDRIFFVPPSETL